MKNLIKTNAKKGFSLVELLVVIAVIGVIAAIAIPAMSGIFGKADETKTKRNAQNIVGTFNAARAAGNTTSYADKDAAVTAILSGITGGGAFATSNFIVPISTTEANLAKANIGTTGTGTDLTLTVTAQ